MRRPAAILTCGNCTQPFRVHGKRRETAKCCSKACAYALCAKPKLKCVTCGLAIRHSGAYRGNALYCSRVCQRAGSVSKYTRELTLDRVRELFIYDAESGALHWRGRRDAKRPGRRAGYLDPDGYRHIAIDGHYYLAHRVVWFYAHGEWPPDQIDHKDGVAVGDGISNLRPSTQQQNAWNVKISRNNKSGFKGVSKKRDRWRATIMVDGKQRSLGIFDTPEEAHAAYVAAAQEAFGEFARAA